MNPGDEHGGADTFHERLSAVRLLAMDVDGVLTDGVVQYDQDGKELKSFHVADGLGIVAAQRNGLRIAWISGRVHAGVVQRASELGVAHLMQGVKDKGSALRQLCKLEGITLSEVAFIGDDWNDLPAFEAAGVRFAVSSAELEIRSRADWVSPRPGGRGEIGRAS